MNINRFFLSVKLVFSLGKEYNKRHGIIKGLKDYLALSEKM